MSMPRLCCLYLLSLLLPLCLAGDIFWLGTWTSLEFNPNGAAGKVGAFIYIGSDLFKPPAVSETGIGLTPGFTCNRVGFDRDNTRFGQLVNVFQSVFYLMGPDWKTDKVDFCKLGLPQGNKWEGGEDYYAGPGQLACKDNLILDANKGPTLTQNGGTCGNKKWTANKLGDFYADVLDGDAYEKDETKKKVGRCVHYPVDPKKPDDDADAKIRCESGQWYREHTPRVKCYMFDRGEGSKSCRG